MSSSMAWWLAGMASNYSVTSVWIRLPQVDLSQYHPGCSKGY